MALAANPARRSGRARSTSWAARPSASTSSLPSPTGCRRRQWPRTPAPARRRDPRQAAGAAEQRRGVRGGDRKSARVVLGQSGIATGARRAAKRRPAADRLCEDGRRSGAVSGDLRRTLAQSCRCWNTPPPAAGCLTIKTERDGIVRRVPLVMQAADTIVPAITLEMLRDGHQFRSDPDQDRSGRRPLGRDAGPANCPPTSNGQLWINFTAARSGALRLGQGCPGRQGAGRADCRQAGADRHLGGRSARSEGDAGRRLDAGRRGAGRRCSKICSPARCCLIRITRRWSNCSPL